jgi:inosine-uridine nucleoside N-ribohydrolase
LTADFNFSHDPEAAHITLASGHNLITLVPKELCQAHGLAYVELKIFLNCSKLKNKVFA